MEQLSDDQRVPDDASAPTTGERPVSTDPGGARPPAGDPVARTEPKPPAAAPADAMRERSRDVRQLIRQGLASKDPAEQLRCFQRAHERDLNDPAAMSFYGMALAEVQHHYQQGIVFCEEAVRRMGPNPDLLVNLAKAYLAAKNKREAVRALRRAMARAMGEEERVRAELAALGLRRPPVIPFLPRTFFLNKYLGILRHRLLTRRLSRDDGTKPIPAELGQLSGDVEAARRSLPPGPASEVSGREP